MRALKVILMIQALVLLAYGLPYLLVPKWTTALTQQLPAPEDYILRALGIACLILALIELKVVGDLERYRDLTLMFALLPSLFFLTIVLQASVRGFNGAAWYWWLNGAVTGVFAVALFAARGRAAAA
jgi:uncharacterized protein YjeT (DUF2065 family)